MDLKERAGKLVDQEVEFKRLLAAARGDADDADRKGKRGQARAQLRTEEAEESALKLKAEVELLQRQKTELQSRLTTALQVRRRRMIA